MQKIYNIGFQEKRHFFRRELGQIDEKWAIAENWDKSPKIGKIAENWDKSPKIGKIAENWDKLPKNLITTSSKVARFFLVQDTKTRENVPNDYKIWPKNISNSSNIDQMVIKDTNIFHCKTLQNLPIFGFLVWKQIIWQPLSTGRSRSNWSAQSVEKIAAVLHQRIQRGKGTSENAGQISVRRVRGVF
jgi:hypothetical protein